MPVTHQELGELWVARGSQPLWDFPVLCFYHSIWNYRSMKKCAPHVKIKLSLYDTVMTLSSTKTISNLLTKLRPTHSSAHLPVHPPIFLPSIHPFILPSTHHLSIIHSPTKPHVFSEDLSPDTGLASELGEVNMNQVRFLPCWVILQSGESSPRCRVPDTHAGSCRSPIRVPWTTFMTQPCAVQTLNYTL